MQSSCKTAERERVRQWKETSTESKTASKIQYSHTDAGKWREREKSKSEQITDTLEIWIQYTSKFRKPCARHVQVISVWFF